MLEYEQFVQQIMVALDARPELKKLIKYKLNQTEEITNVECHERQVSPEASSNPACVELPGLGECSDLRVPHETGTGDVHNGSALQPEPSKG